MKKNLLALSVAFLLTLTAASCGSKDDASSRAASKTAASNSSVISQTESETGSEESGAAGESQVSGAGVSSVQSRSSSSTAIPKVDTNVNVKTGTKALEQGLNFGGKTFTMAATSELYYSSNAFKRLVKAFETKFKCKISIDTLQFGTYNKQVAAKKSTGKPYDICFQHGSMYPAGVIANLFEPMTDVITTADLMDAKNPSAGGIDMEKSRSFAWKNELYGLSAYRASNPYLIYYNKKMLSEAGVTDLMKLYEQGKWDWEMLKKIGKDVTDKSNGIYFGNSTFYGRGLFLANGSEFIKFVNGVPVENLTDRKVYNALKFVQDIFYGANQIMLREATFGDPAEFYKGKVFMFTEESDRYSTFMSEIVKQNAFGKNANNLGIVPVPLGPDNTEKKYPNGWLTSVCAGRGTSDKRAAAAWVKFAATYKDPVRDAYEFSAKDQALVDSLRNNIIFERATFESSSDNTNDLIMLLRLRAVLGEDINKEVTEIRQKVKACIDATLSGK